MGAILVTRIDGFLGELEQIHVDGGIRVPDHLAARLTAFLADLPAGWPASFPVRTRIACVIESLFNLQDEALDLKVPGRRSMRSVDVGLDWPGAEPD